MTIKHSCLHCKHRFVWDGTHLSFKYGEDGKLEYWAATEYCLAKRDDLEDGGLTFYSEEEYNDNHCPYYVPKSVHKKHMEDSE